MKQLRLRKRSWLITTVPDNFVMTEMKKLTVLGGSSIASPTLIQEMLLREDRPPFEICLVGRTKPKLEKVAAACAALTENAHIPLKITSTTNLEKGVTGADYILNQIRVGGYQARAYDERFPKQFGILGEETFGPGGMNNAKRTIPVVLEYCKAIEAYASNALVLNLTNPNSFIQYAVTRYSKVDIIGVCDSPVGIGEAIAEMVGVPYQELWFQYVGMHHFGWVTKALHNGVDLMPAILEKLDQVPGLPTDADIAKVVGGIPTSYFKYYYHSNRVFDVQNKQEKVRAEQLLEFENKILAEYASERGALPASLKQRGAHWYGASVVPIMLAHTNNAEQVFILNIINGTTLPWLPTDAIIETPSLVTGHGCIPLQPAEIPVDLQAMVQLNATFEMLWVEAVVEQDYNKALRAMMLNHLVHNLDQAKAILNEIWKF
jgi:6-phospho-beta-glucosidase